MAIPGSPLDSRASGCNQLIREGAVLVQTPEEVVELLQSFTGAPRSTFRVAEGAEDFDYAELAEAEWDAGDTQAIAALLSNAPIAVDELIRQSGASAAAVHMALLELELTGELAREADGMVRILGQ
jgi:DNA processing protein